MEIRKDNAAERFKALQLLEVGQNKTAAREGTAEEIKLPDPAKVAGMENAAPEGTAVNNEGNTRLTKEDEEEYLGVGQKLHVRDQKARQVLSSGSAILTTPEQIVDFIRNSITGKTTNSIKGYGRVGRRLADIVSKVTNGEVNIDNYYLELNSNQLAHLGDHIVTEKDTRNIPLSQEQVEHLPDYIDTYDDLIDVIRRKDGSVRLMLGKK